jgi:hypothetical protein
MISGSDYIYSVNIILFNADLTFPNKLGKSARGVSRVRRYSRRVPAARSAGNRVEAADCASFVVFIFLDFPQLMRNLKCTAAAAAAAAAAVGRKEMTE